MASSSRAGALNSPSPVAFCSTPLSVVKAVHWVPSGPGLPFTVPNVTRSVPFASGATRPPDCARRACM